MGVAPGPSGAAPAGGLIDCAGLQNVQAQFSLQQSVTFVLFASQAAAGQHGRCPWSLWRRPGWRRDRLRRPAEGAGRDRVAVGLLRCPPAVARVGCDV